MQSNTTGDVMQIILILTLIVVFFVAIRILYNIKSCIKNIYRTNLEQIEILKRTEELLNEYQAVLSENLIELDDKVVNLSNQIDRSMLALRESLEATKPIKPNNWESFREAFKGPTRIDVNE